MRLIVNRFIRSQAGAVTVDWVVLCAGIVALAVAVVTMMQTGTLSLTGNVATFLTSLSF